MKDKEIIKILKKIKKIKPSKNNKKLVEKNLISFLENEGIKSPYLQIGYFQRIRLIKVLAGIFLLLFFGFSGLAYGAESSVPGDLLYPLKIFGENLYEKTIKNENKRIIWESKKLERRIKEWEKIKKRKKFDFQKEKLSRKRVEEQQKRIMEFQKIKNSLFEEKEKNKGKIKEKNIFDQNIIEENKQSYLPLNKQEEDITKKDIKNFQDKRRRENNRLQN